MNAVNEIRTLSELLANIPQGKMVTMQEVSTSFLKIGDIVTINDDRLFEVTGSTWSEEFADAYYDLGFNYIGNRNPKHPEIVDMIFRQTRNAGAKIPAKWKVVRIKIEDKQAGDADIVELPAMLNQAWKGTKTRLFGLK